MTNLTFGQFYPAKSFVHNMNASVKILLTIAYIVAVFMVTAYHFLGFLACFLFVIITSIFAKIPFLRVLKSIKGILFIVVFSAILQLFFITSGNVLCSWWIFTITDGGLLSAGYITARISLMVLGASLLTLTTTPVDLADGIETLLYPLKFIKFPVHEFALIMSIALRFIPSLMEETDRIIKAQKARGADFESGNIFKRIRALVPVFIPLLISSLRRAEELSNAMDARCYAGSKNRTKYKKLKLTYRDLLGTILVAGLIVGVVYLNGFYAFLTVAL